MVKHHGIRLVVPLVIAAGLAWLIRLLSACDTASDERITPPTNLGIDAHPAGVGGPVSTLVRRLHVGGPALYWPDGRPAFDQSR